ncbi:SDR family NAD(P)-dependent oxidoreductase [Sphingomonas crusticola]|uniref:SDR family NAD(P)-dependent oxidoreductase n=1 Tax=Sphingomonas crusticola TaxID=1697973 RepID=UPI000E21FCD2|nr:SDR family oxidoreductase [Sphingomonas crusticola]
MIQEEVKRTGDAPLAGKIALVTGSGRGLGHMVAEFLANLGAAVAIHDISEDAPAQYGEAPNLSAAAAALAGDGGRAIGVTGDITSEADVARLVEQVEQQLGSISILVNCAGGDIGAAGTKPDPNGALDISLADAMAVFQRNFIGTMLMCRAIAPGMAERSEGTIINFGSLNGHQGVSPEVVYGCAKAAIVHYTRCLALEMRPHGVRVNVVSPGPAKSARFLATRQTDPRMMAEGPSLDRYASPAEIADVVAFLASEQSRFMTGQVLRVDGGIGLYAA